MGKEPNAFVLYEGDIENLQNYIESSLPIIVDKIKDTRTEKEIVDDLNSHEYIARIQKYVSDNQK